MVAAIDQIGAHNNRQGLCGFAAAMMATLDGGGTWHANLANFSESMLQFLEHCRRSNWGLIGDIVTFTRKFRGYEDYVIDTVIANLQAASMGLKPDPGELDVAMTPEAVVYYLQNFRNLARARLADITATPNVCIVGLADGTLSDDIHGGLVHWVYYRAGTIHTYGESYTGGGTLQEALDQMNHTRGDNYWLCQIITL